MRLFSSSVPFQVGLLGIPIFVVRSLFVSIRRLF